MYLTNQIDSAAMPKMLVDATRVANEPTTCDMLFLALLTASGYAMPNYVVRHGKPAHTYQPSLMTLVMAPPASGKGVMNLCKRILQPLHDEKRKEAEALAILAELENSPVAPPEKTAFIPANSSNNAFLQLLLDNDGRGFMMETEMDVLAQIWKRDYGNYSAAFRQAFEHETISKSRKTRGDGFLEVTNPALSVVLSGTLNQLKPLLESRENGLASRFITYLVEDIVPFKKEVFLKHSEQHADATDTIFAHYGQEMLRLYHWLQKARKPCEFRLTEQQAEEMRGYFSDGYLLTLGDLQMPITFDPVVKRLAVSILRIGMIIRMLRYWEDEVSEHQTEGEDVPVPEVLECTDEEFEVLKQITEVLLEHAIAVHQLLPSETETTLQLANDPSGQLLVSLPKQFTTKEAKESGKKMGLNERTVERNMAKWVEQHIVVKTSQGHYTKN